MALNLYVTVPAFKRAIIMAGTDDDEAIEEVLERVSRQADEEMNGRPAYPVTATRKFDVDRSGESCLFLDDDLLTVSTLKADEDGDGTYELTLEEDTDYWLWPRNSTPKRAIDLNPQGTQLTSWPKGRVRVELNGVFGFVSETESLGTLGAEIADATTTSVTMTAGHSVERGHTLHIESEDLYVSAVSTNTLTVVRGVNGTAGASHANSLAVTATKFPAQLQGVVVNQAARQLRGQSSGFATSLGGSQTAGQVAFLAFHPIDRSILQKLGAPVVA